MCVYTCVCCVCVVCVCVSVCVCVCVGGWVGGWGWGGCVLCVWYVWIYISIAQPEGVTLFLSHL